MLFKFSCRCAGLILLVILWLFKSHEAIAQSSTDNVDISFGIKAWDPVHIKVEDKKGSAFSTPIVFTALNSTYYSFMLVIDFTQFDNLAPKPPAREIKLSHGINNLYTFSIHVPGQGYGYQYSYMYWLTPSDKIINEEFPYLIPLKEGKEINAKTNLTGRITDSFTGKAGDTVYCMRRGLVTAVPRSVTMDFRLSNHDCLEVLHNDGTYMIYHYLSKSEAFTAPGKIILPGQPIGIFSDSSYLMVTLKKIDEIKNLMVAQPIRYSTGKTGTVSFDQIDRTVKSVHPREVIIMEMKGRELKKAGKER
jgi:hypothetical protein